MKTKLNSFIGLILVSLFTLFLISCNDDENTFTKEELKGDIGPQGPEGQQGQQGSEGQQGPEGQPGADGNANVIVSDWKLATMIKDTIIDNSQMKVATVDAPELTENIVEKAAIIIYINFGSGNHILPYTSYPLNKVSTISFFLKKGKIRPTRFTHDNSNAYSLGTNIKYKYVIIPQGVAHKNSSGYTSQPLYRLNNQLYTLDALKAMSYEELTFKLNLQE